MPTTRKAAESARRFHTYINDHPAEQVSAESPMAALGYLMEPWARDSEGRQRSILANLSVRSGSARGRVYVQGEPPMDVAVWEQVEAAA